MKQIASRVAKAALSFAHLSGPRKGAKAEGDEDKEKDGDEEKAEGDDPDPEDEDKPKDDASTSGEDADAEKEDDEPGEDDDKKNKGKAKGDDDSDEEMRGSSAAAQARRREQARCASIFASPAAGRNPVLAAKLAFNTRMPRDEAVAVLEGTSAPAANTFSPGRQARNPGVGTGASQQRNSRQEASAGMERAFIKANPANAERVKR